MIIRALTCLSGGRPTRPNTAGGAPSSDVSTLLYWWNDPRSTCDLTSGIRPQRILRTAFSMRQQPAFGKRAK